VVDSGAPPQKWGVFAVQDVAEGCPQAGGYQGYQAGGAGGATPRLLLWGFWSVKSNQHRPGQLGYGRGVVGGGVHARARPRKSAIFAFLDGKIPDSPPRRPALRGPRRRGVWGGSPSLPPPLFPGLLGPLEAAVGGRAGEGQTPRSGPRPGTPRPHTFPPPGGPSPPASPCGVYAGIPGDPPQLHAGRPPLRALPMREGELSRTWETCTPSGPSRTMGA